MRKYDRKAGHEARQEWETTEERESERKVKLSEIEISKIGIGKTRGAALALAGPYTINILRRAPIWCIAFLTQVVVTL